MTTNGRLDFVLFGATGFTGGLTAEYLAQQAPAGTHWALAGRDANKLEALRARLESEGNACPPTQTRVADVDDPASLRSLAESARVVATTVGPYLRFGEPLVRACAEVGSDYLDLTGEPEFVDRMWLSYHAVAQASGARLVHCCGFDSIPHDLGALYTVMQLPEHVPLKVEGFVAASGQFSGGTMHSAIHAFSRLRQSAAAARERRSREPRPAGRRVRPAPSSVHYDAKLRSWVVPMPTIDPQVVRRSARELDRYGPDFCYAHYLQLKRLRSVAALTGSVAAAVALAQLGPTRRMLLSRKSPGEGPDADARARGWFRVRFRGQGGGRHVLTEVRGGDPGYGETAKMLAESTLCLAFDALPRRAGQLTPAAAMGAALIARLQAAGIGFSTVAGVS